MAVGYSVYIISVKRSEHIVEKVPTTCIECMHKQAASAENKGEEWCGPISFPWHYKVCEWNMG